MLRRKLQIFVSSTHGDLVDVRLAAMEAILAAGHIPAAMEQFPPGDQTALEKIEAWIRQSDAYLLILGGRYGSRLPRSKKSYVEHEYDYALKRGIPFCSLVATDSALQQRAVVTVASETSTPEYRAFRTKVQRYHLSLIHI